MLFEHIPFKFRRGMKSGIFPIDVNKGDQGLKPDLLGVEEEFILHEMDERGEENSMLEVALAIVVIILFFVAFGFILYEM